MNTQVVVIHGGQAYTTYDDFIQHLATKEVEYDTFFKRHEPRWKELLPERLGDAYDVAKPTMPNYQNAKFDEWKLWFERIIPFLRDDVILVGHSLGAMFLAKYLSENIFPRSIEKLFLIAPALVRDGINGGEDGGEFLPNPDMLINVTKQCERVHIFHSKDDEVVPYTHAEKYMQHMPDAELLTFEDSGHFITEDIPELVEYIRK